MKILGALLILSPIGFYSLHFRGTTRDLVWSDESEEGQRHQCKLKHAMSQFEGMLPPELSSFASQARTGTVYRSTHTAADGELATDDNTLYAVHALNKEIKEKMQGCGKARFIAKLYYSELERARMNLGVLNGHSLGMTQRNTEYTEFSREIEAEKTRRNSDADTRSASINQQKDLMNDIDTHEVERNMQTWFLIYKFFANGDNCKSTFDDATTAAATIHETQLLQEGSTSHKPKHTNDTNHTTSVATPKMCKLKNGTFVIDHSSEQAAAFYSRLAAVFKAQSSAHFKRPSFLQLGSLEGVNIDPAFDCVAAQMSCGKFLDAILNLYFDERTTYDEKEIARAVHAEEIKLLTERKALSQAEFNSDIDALTARYNEEGPELDSEEADLDAQISAMNEVITGLEADVFKAKEEEILECEKEPCMMKLIRNAVVKERYGISDLIDDEEGFQFQGDGTCMVGTKDCIEMQGTATGIGRDGLVAYEETCYHKCTNETHIEHFTEIQEKELVVLCPSNKKGASAADASTEKETLTEPCRPAVCPIDAVFGLWANWGDCMQDGATFKQTRERSLLSAARFGGKETSDACLDPTNRATCTQESQLWKNSCNVEVACKWSIYHPKHMSLAICDADASQCNDVKPNEVLDAIVGHKRSYRTLQKWEHGLDTGKQCPYDKDQHTKIEAKREVQCQRTICKPGFKCFGNFHLVFAIDGSVHTSDDKFAFFKKLMKIIIKDKFAESDFANTVSILIYGNGYMTGADSKTASLVPPIQFRTSYKTTDASVNEAWETAFAAVARPNLVNNLNAVIPAVKNIATNDERTVLIVLNGNVPVYTEDWERSVRAWTGNYKFDHRWVTVLDLTDKDDADDAEQLAASKLVVKSDDWLRGTSNPTEEDTGDFITRNSLIEEEWSQLEHAQDAELGLLAGRIVRTFCDHGIEPASPSSVIDWGPPAWQFYPIKNDVGALYPRYWSTPFPISPWDVTEEKCNDLIRRFNQRTHNEYKRGSACAWWKSGHYETDCVHANMGDPDSACDDCQEEARMYETEEAWVKDTTRTFCATEWSKPKCRDECGRVSLRTPWLMNKNQILKEVSHQNFTKIEPMELINKVCGESEPGTYEHFHIQDDAFYRLPDQDGLGYCFGYFSITGSINQASSYRGIDTENVVDPSETYHGQCHAAFLEMIKTTDYTEEFTNMDWVKEKLNCTGVKTTTFYKWRDFATTFVDETSSSMSLAAAIADQHALDSQ